MGEIKKKKKKKREVVCQRQYTWVEQKNARAVNQRLFGSMHVQQASSVQRMQQTRSVQFCHQYGEGRGGVVAE